jgi:Ulp1 family protease
MKLTTLYKKGYHRIGIAINTDTHDGPGEHWTAVFCDIRPDLEFPRMTYFDSYGYKPEREIKRLMTRWATQWDATGLHSKPMQLTYNKTRHQRKNSECGMYCIYFHLNCLTEMPMNKVVPDEVINAFRDVLFKIPRK